MSSDFKELLNIFNEKKVKYLIIGGYAVSEYAEPRYTKDLDIWIEASAENSKRVYDALKEFKAPLFDLKASDFAQGGSFYQMGKPPVRVDILMSLEGMSFGAAWRRRNKGEFLDVEVNFISIDDLVKSKKLSGRCQDLADVENLLLAKKLNK